MCGRFALTLPAAAAARLFAAAADPAALALDRPRHNIRPTDPVLAAAAAPEGGRRLTAMRWGFAPPWATALEGARPLINARAETIAEKPAFREACRTRRCLIPADGFYEWRAAAGRGAEPHWIEAADGAPLVFAGIWSAFTPPGGGPATLTCAIVTCAANAAMAPLHERLPVALAPDDWALWLGEAGRGAARLMRAPADGFYRHHRVRSLINRSGAKALDGPELRAPLEPGAPDPGPDADAPRLL